MNTVTPMYEWNTLPWQRLEQQVYKLQKRIYQASKRGDVKGVHRLQRLLMKSWAARCLAVRKVTQDNQGKKTAGVDGIKSLSPSQRRELAQDLKLPQKARPTRRVWIPKPGTAEQRPLGIPTIHDRAAQALAKLALEPEWEAKFEPNSYGFRPGRSCHDAMVAIYDGIRFKAKYVLDADIAKCFDRINHQALLHKLRTFPALRRAIKAWLAAGVMEGKELFPTTEGTPQGGVISPLLANIALHGLETVIRESFSNNYQGRRHWKPLVVRYADDFVVMHPDLAVIEQVGQITSDWLVGMGLELKPSKTRITHTLQEHEGNLGFDFLGFQVRQYPVGKTHYSRLAGSGHWLPFKTIIKPSKEALERHSKVLSQVIRAHNASTQAALIGQLNPIIRGWANYYSTECSKASYSKMDTALFHKLWSWARRRHHNKSRHWIARKYWHRERGTWDFSAEGIRLVRHVRTPIRRHIRVKGTRSPFDGDWVYWTTRLGGHPELPRRVATLLRWQQGKCAQCGRYFNHEDLLEVDHILPRSMGGKDTYSNWQLLHRHCHDAKTAEDLRRKRGTYDKSLSVEEPDEAKASRPVLETSRLGDRPA
jgi:RNA-directed DNA polymerase